MRASRFFHWVLVCTLVTSACDDTDDSRMDGGSSVDAQVRDARTIPHDAGTTMDAGFAMDAGREVDAGGETDAGPCAVWGPWGNAVQVAVTATEAAEGGGTLSADGRALFFNRQITGRRNDLFVATRDSTSEPFEFVTELDYLNTLDNEAEASISPDGLSLYFHAERPSGYTTYVATRERTSDAFTNLRCALADCAVLFAPTIGLDLRTIYGYVRIDAQTSTLVEAHRASSDVQFGAPTDLNATYVNVMNTEAAFPGVSPDGLEIYYNYVWSGSQGAADIWVATRANTSESFGDPHRVEELSTPVWDEDVSISANGRFLVMTRGDDYGTDLWIYERTCQ